MIKILLALSFFLTGEIHAQQNYNKLNVKELDVTSRVNVISTTKSSKPCPVMTLVQRDAIATPPTGSCVYNSTDLQLNVYDGSLWQSAGGGGIENWDTATAYDVDDVVIESNKIYQCDIAHTSGTFATDLAANRWVELSAQGNLTGVISSTGLATTITSQTGTGTTFVVQNTPTLTTPNIGAATGTSLTLAGNISAYNYDKDNMFINGNFENPLGAEWTCTVGTCSRTTATGEFSKDTAALKVVLSAQSMNVSQTVTTPSGIQKQGYVGFIYRIPASGIVTPTVTITVDSVLQVTVPTNKLIMDGLFHSLEVPITFGSTDVKISFLSGSSTGSVFFDGIYLKQGIGLQNLQGDTVYSATVTTTSGVISNQNNPNGTLFSSCTAANPTVCTFTTGRFTATPNCTQQNGVAGSGFITLLSSISSTSITIGTYNPTTLALNASSPTAITCQKSGNDYLAASSQVYSQASANYSERNEGVITIGAVTTPPTKGTASVDKLITSRIGNRIKAVYSYRQAAGGANGSGEYLFSLPSGLAFDSSIVPDATATLYSSDAKVSAFVGVGQAGGGNQGICSLFAYSTTQFRAICGNNAAGTAQGFNTIGSSYVGLGAVAFFSFTVDAPISGWSNANVIVGSFEGIEKCASNGECDDTFSAKVSDAGVVTDENTDWINGSAVVSDTSLYTFTFKTNTFTVSPNCWAVGSNTANAFFQISTGTLSSTGVAFRARLTTTAANQASSFHIICQKSGVDYKPKTAKVASSIGVPTVPGVTTEAIDTFSVSYGTTNATTVCSASPCSYLDQIGTAVTSITRSGAGTYPSTVSKTYSKLKCTGLAGGSTGFVIDPITCSSCSTFTITSRISASPYTATDSYGTLNCTGSY